jgi:hypothetical protein
MIDKSKFYDSCKSVLPTPPSIDAYLIAHAEKLYMLIIGLYYIPHANSILQLP